jgi:chemotaxis protein MotB
MRQNYLALRAFLLISVLGSCTSSKKLKAAESENQHLKAANVDLEKKLSTCQQQSASLDSRYKAQTTDFQNYKAKCEKDQQDLAALRAVLKEEAAALERLETKLEEALAKFKEKGVDVYYENGLVRVTMADDLMYKSGSSALGAEGKEVLGSLASVLNEDFPQLKVIVVGNTDSVQFKKGSDNWTLSTERANGVVRVLRDTYHVDPTRLTAAGKSKYNPRADNSTPEGRAMNRRTDIILNPDLVRLWESAKTQ